MAHELQEAFLPNDPKLMGAVMPGDPVPIVTHLHGGENHPQFDGTPLQWFTKDGAKGPHYVTNRFTYYNEQRPSMVWYHDHVLGNTRTNVYAGLAGAYIIRDADDAGEPDNRQQPAIRLALHILEHEDNDMMRAFEVVRPAP